MADLRESFPILEDVATQAGLPLHKALEGDPAAGKNAHGALVAKTAAGNLTYLTLDANGALPVSQDTTGQACLSDEGGVSGTTSFQTVASITLTNDATYKKLEFMGSCFRDAVYEVVQIDDSGGTPVETVHATFRTTAGHPNEAKTLNCVEFIAGSTGICLLNVRAKQLQNAASDIDALVAIFEQQ